MAARNTLAIIPARGGSKGIPGKNTRSFAGKPLLVHSIEAALQCPLVTRTVVSTDDDRIAGIASAHGAEVSQRPDELSADTSLVIDAIRYTVREVEEDGFPVHAVMLLEPTSPLRRPQDMEMCLRVVLDGKADSAATFTQSPISPNRLWRIDGDLVEPYIKGAVPWLPRQKQPVAFELTGQVYALSRQILLDNEDAISTLLGRIYPVLTPKETAVDIDTELDFLMAEKLMEYFQDRDANRSPAVSRN